MKKVPKLQKRSPQLHFSVMWRHYDVVVTSNYKMIVKLGDKSRIRIITRNHRFQRLSERKLHKKTRKLARLTSFNERIMCKIILAFSCWKTFLIFNILTKISEITSFFWVIWKIKVFLSHVKRACGIRINWFFIWTFNVR